MKTTPWDEARLEALSAVVEKVELGSQAEWLAGGVISVALNTLSRHGWRLVPAEATEEMLIAARDWSYAKYGKPVGNDGALGCHNAMTEAGDVLRPARAEGGGTGA